MVPALDTLNQSSFLQEEDNNPDVTECMNEYFGDELQDKRSKTIRVGFVNINSLPKLSSAAKYDSIKASLTAAEIDIIGLAETNKCWYMMEAEHTWKETAKTWWKDSKHAIAYNTLDQQPQLYQPGGVITSTINSISHRAFKSGIDPSGLGRWSWITLRGSNSIKTTIITTYRPCRSLQGPNTTFAQHLRYYNLIGRRDKCPRELLLDDLKDFITELNENGHQIILLADMNQKVSDSALKEWARKIHLKEHLSTTHGDTPTHNNGSHPIDGIFVSPSLHIKESGYLPFGWIHSDHRMLWLDITEASVLGFNLPPILSANGRRLQCSDPRIYKRWIQLYKKYVLDHKLHLKAYELEDQTIHPLTREMQQKLDSLLEHRRRGMEHADKYCRKLKTGGVPYSPALAKQRIRIELWEAVCTKKTGRRYSFTKLRRLAKKVQVTNPMSCSLEEAKEILKDTYKTYYSMKKDAVKLRISHLDSKAEAIAKETDSDKTTVLKQMKEREQQRTDARIIKAVLQKMSDSAISKVEVTRDNTTIELTKEDDIVHALIEENENKYTQSEDTPPLQEPLKSLLGELADTPFCDSILEGTADIPETVGPYGTEFLQHLKKPPNITLNQIPAYISTSTFQSGWNKMKEHTAAGISGIHFGHMKTCAKDEMLSSFESSIAQIAYGSGSPPASWKNSIICMIKKKSQVEHISGLRSVVLTEADFNFNNKILGKSTMAAAETAQVLAKEQYGSRKGKSAIDHALHKRITYDILRQTRTPGVLCSNDAKSCYDRIVHTIAILAYRRLGIQQPPVECMIKSIQRMKHHFRTSYGTSKLYLSRDMYLSPFQGILQGNGAAPATWVTISSPLLDMLRTAGNGGKFTSPVTQTKTHIVGYAFVDDTDLITLDMNDDEITTEEVMEAMQSAIQRWEGGLKMTGGAIVPEKSWIYPIDFKFDEQGRWSYKSTEEIDFQFTVKDHKDNVCILTQVEPDIGKETLGVYLSPNGNNTQATEAMKAKAEKWRSMVAAGHLKKKLAWQAWETTIIKSLEYPLPALSLSKAECKEIMKPVLKIALPKTTLASSFPRKVLYGPLAEGGLGVHSLYTTQGALHLERLQCYLGTDTITGDLLTISLESAQLEIGVGRSLFSLDYEKFSFLLTDCWIKGVWKFAAENDIKIKDYFTKFPPLSRDNDLYLMEIFQNEGYSKSKLIRINKCRQYLRVLTLSDVMNGFGDGFSCAYNCIRNKEHISPYTWPRQTKPANKYITDWKSALRKSFGLRNGITEYTLGNWSSPPESTWKWLFSPNTELLYQPMGHITKVWKRTSNRGTLGRKSRFRYFTNSLAIPNDVIRATIHKVNENTLILTGWRQHHNNPHSYYTNRVYSDWILQHDATTAHTHQILAHSLRRNELIVVSDGSYYKDNNIGGAAWVIENLQQTHRTFGNCPSPGPPSAQCAYRSELIGLLGAIMHVNHIANTFNIQAATVKLFCDGKSAIDAISTKHIIIHNNRKHFDILQSIQQAKALHNINWQIQHVEGHSDELDNFDNLSRTQQLNVMVDRRAKAFVTQLITQNAHQDLIHLNLPFTRCEISYYTNERKLVPVHSKLLHTIRDSISTTKIRKYWINTPQLSTKELEVDWTLKHMSHSNTSKGINRWLAKHNTGFCGVGKQLHRYKFQTHSDCPRCGTTDETTDHVLQCKETSACELWDNEVRSLQLWMKKEKVLCRLSDIIIFNLNSWKYSIQRPNYLPSNIHLQRAILQQDSIGWDNFIKGFWSKSWRMAQEEEFKIQGSTKSALNLISKLQRKIWMIAWALWTNRNDYLHKKCHSTHTSDRPKIDEEVIKEWEAGSAELDNTTKQLFNGTLQDKMKMTYHSKRLWLSSIWLAKEAINPNYLSTTTTSPNNSIRFKYERWKAKAKKRSNT